MEVHSTCLKIWNYLFGETLTGIQTKKTKFRLEEITEPAASSYQVTFTPDQTECYATVEGTVGILTQTGLAVVGMAG